MDDNRRKKGKQQNVQFPSESGANLIRMMGGKGIKVRNEKKEGSRVSGEKDLVLSQRGAPKLSKMDR